MMEFRGVIKIRNISSDKEFFAKVLNKNSVKVNLNTMVKSLIIFISLFSFVLLDAASLWNKSNSAKRGLLPAKELIKLVI